MAGLMADARKTALGAGGLVFLALWFAASGGPADIAVMGAAELARRQKASPEPTAAASGSPAVAATAAPSWFAPDTDATEPMIDIPPPTPAGTGANTDPNAIYRPPPTGPDFPPGNR